MYFYPPLAILYTKSEAFKLAYHSKIVYWEATPKLKFRTLRRISRNIGLKLIDEALI